MVLACFVAAVVCWLAGAFKVSFNTGTPDRRWAPDWLQAGLFFTGLGLWIAPLL